MLSHTQLLVGNRTTVAAVAYNSDGIRPSMSPIPRFPELLVNNSGHYQRLFMCPAILLKGLRLLIETISFGTLSIPIIALLNLPLLDPILDSSTLPRRPPRAQPEHAKSPKVLQIFRPIHPFRIHSCIRLGVVCDFDLLIDPDFLLSTQRVVRMDQTAF
jgi:hypothetical protein